MKRTLIFFLGLFVSSCSSFGWSEVATGLCIAGDANCLKSCRRDYKEYGSVLSYESCTAMCGAGDCAF